jgi:hypothetical protein
LDVYSALPSEELFSGGATLERRVSFDRAVSGEPLAIAADVEITPTWSPRSE